MSTEKRWIDYTDVGSAERGDEYRLDDLILQRDIRQRCTTQIEDECSRRRKFESIHRPSTRR